MMNSKFPEDGTYDDIALMYKLLAEAKRVAYHGLPKYTFFRHSGNNSAWTTDHSLLTAETLEEYLSAYRTRTEWLCRKFPDKAQTWQYFEWSFMTGQKFLPMRPQLLLHSRHLPFATRNSQPADFLHHRMLKSRLIL